MRRKCTLKKSESSRGGRGGGELGFVGIQKSLQAHHIKVDS